MNRASRRKPSPLYMVGRSQSDVSKSFDSDAVSVEDTDALPARALEAASNVVSRMGVFIGEE